MKIITGLDNVLLLAAIKLVKLTRLLGLPVTLLLVLSFLSLPVVIIISPLLEDKRCGVVDWIVVVVVAVLLSLRLLGIFQDALAAKKIIDSNPGMLVEMASLLDRVARWATAFFLLTLVFVWVWIAHPILAPVASAGILLSLLNPAFIYWLVMAYSMDRGGPTLKDLVRSTWCKHTSFRLPRRQPAANPA